MKILLSLLLIFNFTFAIEHHIKYKSFQAHEFDIFSLDITDDGKYGVSGSYDQTIKLWDLDEGKMLLELDNHTDSVISVKFSTDEKKIFSASKDKKVILWNLKKQTEDALLNFSSEITTMIVNKENNIVIVGDSYGKVTISSIEGMVLYELDQNVAEITSLALSSDERYLIAGSENGTISIWDSANDYKLIAMFQAHTSAVNSIATTKDSSFFVSAGADNLIKIWNFDDLKLIKILQGHTDSIESVVISNDNKTIISAGNDNTIRIWEYQSSKEPIVLKKHTSTVNTLALSKDNSRLISAGLDQKIFVWDIYLFSYASKLNTIEAYDKYMQIYPDSIYNKIAMKRIFNIYKKKNTINAYKQYIKKYKNSKYLNDALQTIYKMAFKKAKKKNTIQAYNEFIFDYPKAPQVSQANQAVAKKEIEKYIQTVYGENAKTIGTRLTQWTNKTVLFFTESSKVEKILNDANKILQESQNKKQKLGYYIVANRLYSILHKSEFNDNGTASRFFNSQKYKDFQSELQRLQNKKYTIQDLIYYSNN